MIFEAPLGHAIGLYGTWLDIQDQGLWSFRTLGRGVPRPFRAIRAALLVVQRLQEGGTTRALCH
jgi:hypothetical protein